MEPKAGYKTTEFWVTAVVNVLTAVLGILAIRGLVTDEEVSLYLDLGRALVAALAPLVLAYTTSRYAESRTRVKEAAANAAHNGRA